MSEMGFVGNQPFTLWTRGMGQYDFCSRLLCIYRYNCLSHLMLFLAALGVVRRCPCSTGNGSRSTAAH